jgi:hypothetical protein
VPGPVPVRARTHVSAGGKPLVSQFARSAPVDDVRPRSQRVSWSRPQLLARDRRKQKRTHRRQEWCFDRGPAVPETGRARAGLAVTLAQISFHQLLGPGVQKLGVFLLKHVQLLRAAGNLRREAASEDASPLLDLAVKLQPAAKFPDLLSEQLALSPTRPGANPPRLRCLRDSPSTVIVTVSQ